jgi:hypothetical protein
MLALLLACTGADDLPPPEEPFRGEAQITVEGSHAGPEDVTLAWVGWSRFREDAALTLVASDDAGLWDLVVVFQDDVQAGTVVPQKVFFKRGTQLFLDAGASCSAELTGSGGADAPWAMALSCTDLVTEEGSPNHEDALFSLVATVAGETFTQDDYRANRFTTEGWFAGPQLVNSPFSTEAIDFRDIDLAVVLPWRDGATWVLWDDGQDSHLDDVLLRISPGDGEWLIERWVRWGMDPATGAALDVIAETEITMGVQGRDQDTTGSEFSFTVWDSLQDGEDDSVVVVVK